MSGKGFGTEVRIPSEYIAHPKDTDELLHLKREVENYIRPEYKSCTYRYTAIVNVKDIKQRKNVGRKRGNDRKVYDRVARNLEKGYKIGKLPPVILLNEDTNKLENWLVNGNHRWMWYVTNNYEWMLVDVYTTNDGYDDGDVIDEVGLLHQPQPDGTESNYDDYKARGKDWVRRQKERGIDVTQEMVNEWVDTFAVNEIAINRTNLKTYIFKDEVKDSFLTNYTQRSGPAGLIEIFKKHNIIILDSGATVTTEIVDRLYEASQKVWIRDFLPVFLANAAEGIKTRLNFYVNTKDVADGNELLKVISTRIKELRGMLDSLDIIYKDSEVDLRDFLIIGKRPFQIDGVDEVDKLQDIVEEIQSPNQVNVRMWQMTLKLLQSRFENRCFTATEAFDTIRPVRTTVTKFKNEKSFKGTILAELQILRNKGILHFVDNEGTYCFR
tara:strand:- start:2556 stop:3875 length:1320 start_codon:yes stop_codon:yes gene_type:complete